jgi:hypothetical protein
MRTATPRAERVAVAWISRWSLTGGRTAKLLDGAPRLRVQPSATSDGLQTRVKHVRRYAGVKHDEKEYSLGTLLVGPWYRRRKTQELRLDKPVDGGRDI